MDVTTTLIKLILMQLILTKIWLLVRALAYLHALALTQLTAATHYWDGLEFLSINLTPWGASPKQLVSIASLLSLAFVPTANKKLTRASRNEP